MIILNTLKQNLINIPGWHTNRKIVVFESDDWGNIRMPNKETLNSIPDKYIKHYKSPYYLYDTLASSKDLEYLFEVLLSVKDSLSNNAKLTANCIMVNPDFEKIKASNFSKYEFEHFTKTIDKYYGNNVFDLWKEGISNKIFVPQLHGREHVDVVAWMNKLKNGDELYLDAFDRNIFSVDHDLIGNKKNLTTALDNSNTEESLLKASFISDGAEIFKKIFGYYSTSFIAPSFTWNKDVERALSNKGVKYFQGINVQKIPTNKELIYKFRRNYTGKRNEFNQYYLNRNVIFEPSIDSKKYGIDAAMDRIKWSFILKKPAIISTHRLNYIGSIDEKNRDTNLNLLSKLLKAILNLWPDVEFMSSNELGDLISR